MTLPAEIRRSPLDWVQSAKTQVLACEDVEILKEMADQAKAVLSYLNSKLGRVSEEARQAAELGLMVKRRIGELLPPAEHGGDRRSEKRSSPPSGLEIDKRRASEFRALAEIPEEQFSAYVSAQQEAGKPPSVKGALALREEAKEEEPSDAASWDAAHTAAARAEALVVKAIKTLADRMDKPPEGLARSFRESHGRLSEAHRAVAALASRAHRRIGK